MGAVPVLTYHALMGHSSAHEVPLESQLTEALEAGWGFAPSADLGQKRRRALLTFDDGFADLWTHGIEVLERLGIPAVVFVIPSRAGEGPPRPRGKPAWGGSATQAHAEAARTGGAHPAFLRWSEMEALERTGLVEVQSHSWGHAMGWASDEIVGFHLGRCGRTHWTLPQCTGGDERLGIPLYPRRSALACRLYRDDPGLRDHLASWLEDRGGEAYVGERGVQRVTRELRREALRYQESTGERGTWETDEERERRTVEDLVRAREALESRLGGVRDQLALPWGHYDEVTLTCARKAGIRRVYTLDRKPNPVGRIGFLVHRFEPRPKGAWWLRSRLWIYRSTWRTALYGILSGRRNAG
ncbi:polysaccharide deacetylase family protein [Deferrisoma sp.]